MTQGVRSGRQLVGAGTAGMLHAITTDVINGFTAVQRPRHKAHSKLADYAAEAQGGTPFPCMCMHALVCDRRGKGGNLFTSG